MDSILSIDVSIQGTAQKISFDTLNIATGT